jgi:hypothetical protein
MIKIFRHEDLVCHEEIFKKFIVLTAKKRGEASKYFRDLVSFDYNPGNPIKKDEQRKYVFHSMIMNLDDVKTIYEFFKDF